MEHEVRIKRVYSPQEPDDGCRVLVDRLWCRGIKKEDAALAGWRRDIAPSTELRKSFAHQAARFEDFRGAYLKELDANEAAASFAGICREELLTRHVTLLYAAKDESCNNAAVLREWLLKKI